MDATVRTARRGAAVVALWAAACAAAAQAPPRADEHACRSAYAQARVAVAALHDGLRERLLQSTDRGWWHFWHERSPSSAADEIGEALALLRDPAEAAWEPGAVADPEAALQAFGACVQRAPPPGRARLRIAAYELHEGRPDLRGAPVADARIAVDGIEAARTGADGRAELEVPAGPVEVRASVPSTALALAEVQAAPGTEADVALVLDSGKEVVSTAHAAIDALVGTTLPEGFDRLVVRLTEGRQHRPVRYLDRFDIEDGAGNTLFRFDDGVAVDAGGDLRCIDPAALAARLAPYRGRPLRLSVQAVDADGVTWQAERAFRYGAGPVLP
ncbi:hypothetical protein LDO32_00680 [Luteimonas sp. Y-2-2-4F]|nr:carboxypeptidase-like regulatory domain-containing protein [Luteimonas sp. Y-2-2-4F]MCD9030251.1 hypothetical protein [Luteimonas sp. Y-2-2-4F]